MKIVSEIEKKFDFHLQAKVDDGMKCYKAKQEMCIITHSLLVTVLNWSDYVPERQVVSLTA
jgi:hypothetical protein